MAKTEIQFDQEGVRLVRRTWFRRRRIAAAAWSEISRVVAANSDALTHDQIWLFVETVEGSSVQISESWRGFSELRDALPGFLRGADEAWWAALNSGPPFQERRYLVWERF